MLPIYRSRSADRRHPRAPDDAAVFGPQPPPPENRAVELTLRFAHALSQRQHTQRLLPSSTGDSNSTARRRPAASKSCASARRSLARRQRALQDRERQLADAADEMQGDRLEVAVRELRHTVASLERSQVLVDSALLSWRTNRNGVALDVCREYFVHFARGFNGEDPAAAARTATTRAFMARAVEDDVLTRDFRGTEAFLSQWQTYTTCYDNFSARMCSLSVIDDDHRYVSVSAAAEMRFAFSPRSLQALYPHLFAEMQTSAAARATTEKLFGRECRVAFDLVFHFNHHGKVFVTESRVHLASALLDLMADPFAAMRVLNASLITETGHWKTPESAVRESSIELPKSVL